MLPPLTKMTNLQLCRCRLPILSASFFLLLGLLLLGNLTIVYVAADAAARVVVVETQKEGNGPPVTREHRYTSHVTLYIENTTNGDKTPSGWSTRQSDGADRDTPFAFQPGVNLIQGWTEGVLQMKEGERAHLHVPAHLGYGAQPMGNPHGTFYIPANSNLLFDIEILGREGEEKDL